MRTVQRIAWGLMLVAALSGCESLQKKFTRKRKEPAKAPTPVVVFQDYSRAMTPLDRYRKHYLMFDYWTDDLKDALNDTTPNPKRYRRASEESLAELQTMRQLLVEEAGAGLDEFIAERVKIDGQLHMPAFNTSRANSVGRVLEEQDRRIDRGYFWRKVKDQLKEAPAAPPEAPPAP